MSEQLTVIKLSPAELRELVREAVRDELDQRYDEQWTISDISRHFKKSKVTVHKWEKSGYIKRTNPTGHPVFSKKQVLSCEKLK